MKNNKDSYIIIRINGSKKNRFQDVCSKLGTNTSKLLGSRIDEVLKLYKLR